MRLDNCEDLELGVRKRVRTSILAVFHCLPPVSDMVTDYCTPRIVDSVGEQGEPGERVLVVENPRHPFPHNAIAVDRVCVT